MKRNNLITAVPPRASGGQLRLRITATAESILRAGHPWLYAESIRSQSRAGKVGELAVVYDRKDRFLALGLYDPESTLRLRVLISEKARLIDQAFWDERLGKALQRRTALFDERTTGFRYINGESDGFPGLVLDRYGSTLVLKLYTSAWLPWLDVVLDSVARQIKPQRVVLRLSRNISELAREKFGKREGEILKGAELDCPVVFLESALLFEADVIRGQKTGFFLDQRENRRKVETLAHGRAVLNAFSFSGGFSLYAARGGARAVTDLDISAHALAAGDRNFALNQAEPAVSSCDREQIQADAFEWLAQNRQRKFDLVVLDPPSLAKRESERAGAIAAYSKLALLGIRQLTPGGVLLACSCSAHVSEDQFYDAVRKAASKSKTGFTELARLGQPPDHPAALEEAKYLKSIYLRIN